MNGEINKGRNKYFIIAHFVVVALLILSFLKPNNYRFSTHNTNPVESSSVKVLIVGDMMLDRNIRNTIDKIGFEKFFAGTKDLVQSVDVAVANLEGTFTTNPSVTTDLTNKDLQFTFNPALVPSLANLGFDVLGLANNHSFNFGKAGLESTRRYIGSAGMLYYGDPFNKDEISTVISKNGIKIGFVGFHEFYYTNFDKVQAEIVRLKKEVDVLIVTPHWGIEYQKEPTEDMVKWGHKFIDNGADIVIGSHPHVIGTSEEYKGKKIYYSLGNFSFDQYFSKATMQGLGIVIGIDKNEKEIDLHFSEIPIKIERGGVFVGKE